MYVCVYGRKVKLNGTQAEWTAKNELALPNAKQMSAVMNLNAAPSRLHRPPVALCMNVCVFDSNGRNTYMYTLALLIAPEMYAKQQ